LTNEEWKSIAHEVHKRKLEGKESEIKIQGKLIPNKKVRREISRYALPTLIEPQFSGKKELILCVAN
jgi:hypothetical protein